MSIVWVPQHFVLIIDSSEDSENFDDEFSSGEYFNLEEFC